MAEKPRIIDAQFEVVGNHYRVGERHRDPRLRRWIYTGRRDRWGFPLWYRPPRFTRWALALIGVGALMAGWLLLFLGLVAVSLIHQALR